MKNIEKYYDAIKHKLQTTDVMNLYCIVNEIRTGCDDCPEGRNCRECCLKNLEWLNHEYNEQILTDKEKEIIKSMCDLIHMFGGEVVCFRKLSHYIVVVYTNKTTNMDEYMYYPRIKNDMLKGMEIGRNYSLEELGLMNVNG